jgi:hypothetical protein
MTKEVWLPISEYGGFYDISTLGRVRSVSHKRPSKNPNVFYTWPGRVLRPGLSKSGYYYVSLSKNNKIKTVAVHRLMARTFLGWKKGDLIDHVNGDPLDNRLTNLRLCNHQQNSSNKKKYKGSSVYKGVCFLKSRNKWMASICSNYKRKTIGLYDTEIEAAQAYDKKAMELHGEFSNLNFK